MSDFLNELSTNFQNTFKKDKRLLTFSEYLVELEKNPILHLRNSTQYILNTFDYFDRESINFNNDSINRFKLFNAPFATDNMGCVIGQENVQNQIYKILQNFVTEGLPNKLILLHGPNGSAKSSIINSIMYAMENYSHTSEGAIYKFNWIFPLKDKEKINIGFNTEKEILENNSYARLDPNKVLSKLHCEIKDPPIFLIPPNDRKKLIEKIQNNNSDLKNFKVSKYIIEGKLCKKCRQIFEALLSSYKGNFEEVLSHVEVERIFISKRYTMGAISIEPQLHVDAKASMVTYDKSLSMLPPVLQHMNFYIQNGPLISASRGVLEYSDLLKRPIDTWKYLLATTETSTINVADTILQLDLVLFGTCNENQLDAFKQTSEFASFKGRMELVRVPYLLEYSREQKIYDLQLKQINTKKHVTPHTTRIAALWAILTRIKKPDIAHFKDLLQSIVQKITPLEKAFLYNNLEEIPKKFTPEEKKAISGSIDQLFNEYVSSTFYEGRVGASPREVKTIILNSLQNPNFECLSPFSIFYEIKELSQKTSEYEFLNIEVRDGYHDINLFKELIKKAYFDLIENEILNSLGIYEDTDYEKFLNKYILHLTHYLKKEKIKNTATGISEEPDESFMQSFESQIGQQKKSESFRNDVLSTIGAYKIDNPEKKVVYKEVFPTYFKKLKEYNYNMHKSTIEKLEPELERYLTSGEKKYLSKTSLTTIENLINNYNYCEKCAPKTLHYFVKTKYTKTPLLN